jgi:CBS domain containing-hemolysin-like protein
MDHTEAAGAIGEMKTVGEIMVPLEQYPCVRDNTTLREAVEAIESAQIEVRQRKSLPRGLFVYDEIGVFVGFARRRDIMRGLEPKSLVSRPLEYRKKLFDVAVDPNLTELSWDHFVKGIREQGERPIREVMRPIEAILAADDHVMKAVYEMVALDVSPIPVLKDGQVVGVVRTVDVFHELALLLR